MIALTGSLTLVGCGKMGAALLSGWLARGVRPEQVQLVEPNADAVADFLAAGCRYAATPAALPPETPQVLLLAVKPQTMAAVLPEVKALVGPETLVVSIAAGCGLSLYAEALGAQTAIVRAMPNTPAAVGRGMTVLVAGPTVAAAQRDLAEALLSAVGETAWIEDEALMDPVTALSGGGPAYVFLLAESLAKAGVAAGLPADLAERLARETVAGAGELLHRAAEPASRLRENVTSPGGTTLEALKVLMAEEGLQPLLDRAIAAASRRSRELSS